LPNRLSVVHSNNHRGMTLNIYKVNIRFYYKHSSLVCCYNVRNVQCHPSTIVWIGLTEGIFYCWYLNSWIDLFTNYTLLYAPQIKMISQYVPCQYLIFFNICENRNARGIIDNKLQIRFRKINVYSNKV